MANPRFTVGDTLPPLTGTCTSDPGTGTPAPVNGTTATSVAHILRPDGTIISRSVTVASDGTWSLAWQAGDLTVPGRYPVEVEMTFPGSSVETFGPASFNVVAQIA